MLFVNKSDDKALEHNRDLKPSPKEYQNLKKLPLVEESKLVKRQKTLGLKDLKSL